MSIKRSLGLFLLAVGLAGWPLPLPAQISVGVSIRIAPPELVVYEQPPIPEVGYIWAPGYWAYGPEGYFWVPGTWVRPPVVGVLWTPGYWGWREGVYVWNDGYWGPHVGYYGGINYGYGYGGLGYEGGRWEGGVISYNRTVNNFGNVTVVNVYNKTVINNATVNKLSFNGPGGTSAQPTPQEQIAAHEQHTPATPLQTQHVQAASTNHALLASVNHGAPAIAATAKPAAFSGPGVIGAKGATGQANVPANGNPIKGADKSLANNPSGGLPKVGGLPKDEVKEHKDTTASGGPLKGANGPVNNLHTDRTLNGAGVPPGSGGANPGLNAPGKGAHVGGPSNVVSGGQTNVPHPMPQQPQGKTPNSGKGKKPPNT